MPSLQKRYTLQCICWYFLGSSYNLHLHSIQDRNEENDLLGYIREGLCEGRTVTTYHL